MEAKILGVVITMKTFIKFLLEDFDDDEQYAQDERFINNLSSTIDEIKKYGATASYANVADSMKMNVDELKDELEHLGEIYVSGPFANKIKSLLSVLK